MIYIYIYIYVAHAYIKKCVLLFNMKICCHPLPAGDLDPKTQDIRRGGELREQNLQPTAGHDA